MPDDPKLLAGNRVPRSLETNSQNQTVFDFLALIYQLELAELRENEHIRWLHPNLKRARAE